ncbi:MAG: isochorismatase family cysteine hydrolase [Amaricoccus sp.]
MVEVVPELARYAPPAETVDKPVYSPWIGSPLRERLAARGCDTLILTGGETDMCVLATLLGAVDWGYRVILVHDALCSSSDESHEAMLALFSARFSEQVELASIDEVLSAWSNHASSR